MTASTPSRFGDAIRIALALFAIWLLAQLLWRANALVLLAFLGVLFGLAVEAGVDWSQRWRRWKVPRGVTAAAIVLGAVLLLFGVGAALAPAIREQSAEVRTRVPEAVDRLELWLERRGINLVPAATDTAGRAQASQQLRQTLGQVVGTAARYVFPFLSQTVAVIGGLFLIMFVAIYIGAEPDLYHRGVMLLFPPGARTRAGEVLSGIAGVLRKWLVTQLIAMIVIAVVTTIGLSILQVKAAFALGLLAGLLEFVPTLGPLLSAVPAIAMGFVDSPQKGLAVMVLYVGIQFLENNLLIPMLMKGGVNVPPVLTILGQALLTLLFGFLGLMVAVPLIAAIMVAVKMLYVDPHTPTPLSSMTPVPAPPVHKPPGSAPA